MKICPLPNTHTRARLRIILHRPDIRAVAAGQMDHLLLIRIHDPIRQTVLLPFHRIITRPSHRNLLLTCPRGTIQTILPMQISNTMRTAILAMITLLPISSKSLTKAKIIALAIQSSGKENVGSSRRLTRF